MAGLSELNQHEITFVVGPTAAGKSTWALNECIAKRGVIVNADSVQIFKYLNIGAAKPSIQDKESAPHFLYDLVNPDESFTAGDYRRHALAVIQDQISKHPLYIVGGSGFYIQALEKGMYQVKPISPEIRLLVKELAKEGGLYERLSEVDSASAYKIGKGDPYRLERTLEVVLNEGRTMSEIEDEFKQTQSQLASQYRVNKIGIYCSREQLRKRVEGRTKAMLDSGLLDEVQGLLDRGYRDCKALQSIGYRECVDFLDGKSTQDQLFSKIVTSTMQLAKRQMTWFRRDKEIVWRELDQRL